MSRFLLIPLYERTGRSRMATEKGRIVDATIRHWKNSDELPRLIALAPPRPWTWKVESGKAVILDVHGHQVCDCYPDRAALICVAVNNAGTWKENR